MSQLYKQDSGAMIHQGKTETEYQTEPFWDWDAEVHAIANSAQTFPTEWTSRRWLFVPSIGRFFRNSPGNHAILKAAATLFDPSRWEEIEDLLDEHADIQSMVRRADFVRVRRKITRVKNKGLITDQEAQTLKSVFAHLPGGV